ncbi:MAG: Mov34/MPN/PAD-1 family protein [Pyrinomonadaceae bacterium]
MIQLAPHLQSEVSAHCEEDYPHECCGLLVGQFSRNGSKQVVEVRRTSNAREQEAKHHRFLIPPEEFLRVERQSTERGLDIVGFYHSHPDHPAVPSQYDLEHAWPAYSYIVVSVRHGRTSDVRSWELQADRTAFSEEEIKKGN